MKLGKKKPAPRALGRQRQAANWERPAAFSYHKKRAERPEANNRQSVNVVTKRRQMLSLHFWAKRSGLLIVIGVAVVCALSIVSLSTKPRIVFLDSAGANRAFHTADQYQQAAADYLAGSIWNKNKITIDTGAASQDLKHKYPELASVSITLPLVGHRPIYYLRANTPAFVLQAVNGQYILDSSGKALLTKDSLAGNVAENLPVITDQTGLHVELGTQVISSQEADFIQVVRQTLSAKQVSIASYTLPAGTAQELDVRLAGQSYVIKFNMHESSTARQQAGTYLATANQLSGQHTVPVQYIDVRVPGRAYYQ